MRAQPELSARVGIWPAHLVATRCDIRVHVKQSDEWMLAPVPVGTLRMNLWLTMSLAMRASGRSCRPWRGRTSFRSTTASINWCKRSLSEWCGRAAFTSSAHRSMLTTACSASFASTWCQERDIGAGPCAKAPRADAGAKSWRSINPGLQFLQWSLLALQNGSFDDRRADRHPWKPSDAISIQCGRRQDRYQRYPFLYRTTDDRMEHCSTMGFTSWASTKCPCRSVSTPRRPAGMRPNTRRRGLQCERWITLRSDEMHRIIVANLSWFKSSSGPCGRALKVDMPQLGVKKNDRLEPCAVGKTFDNLVVDHSRPIRICFWRRSEETAIRHRNPLICRALHSSAHHGRRLFALMVFGHLSGIPRVVANRGPRRARSRLAQSGELGREQ